MKLKKIQGYKMYDGITAYIKVGKLKQSNVQFVDWNPGSRRWEAQFFMKDGSVVVKKVVARVGE